jgi:hypothetical protein
VLKDQNGNKPNEIEVSEEIWTETKNQVLQGIVKKIDAAKRLIETDKEIAAGIYIYVVEEFGKYLFLQNSKSYDTRCTILYRNGFVKHEVKFLLALDYFEKHGYDKCKVLNHEGSFSPKSYSWRSYSQGLLVQTEARLSIFYSDFEYSGINKDKDNIGVMKIPTVDSIILNEALHELGEVIKNLNE